MFATATRTAAKQDSTIREHVVAELRWDTHIPQPDRITVSVKDGVVTLTGTVEEYAQKAAAKDAAHRVAGVMDVADEIKVEPPHIGVPDQEIAHAIRQSLKWNVFVPDELVHSTVSNGWVTLTGTVRNWPQRINAGQALKHIAGIRGISNQIVVNPLSADPGQVRNAVQAALERRADREAERLDVTVHDGTVTLAGRVRSWAEKQAVLGAAGHAPGVRSVEDRLVIAPYA